MFIDVFHCYYCIFTLMNMFILMTDLSLCVNVVSFLPIYRWFLNHVMLFYQFTFVREQSHLQLEDLYPLCVVVARHFYVFSLKINKRQKKLMWEYFSLVVKGDTVDECQLWFWLVILEISNPSLTSLPIDERNTLSHTLTSGEWRIWCVSLQFWGNTSM